MCVSPASVPTYESWQLLAPEAQTHSGIEAVEVRSLVALRDSDVDGSGEEDGHIHRDHWARPVTMPTIVRAGQGV